MICRRQVLQLVREMGAKENNMNGTTVAKDPAMDTRWIYAKGVIVTRSFHDRIYIVSMGMNRNVQGRLPLLQCITFHSLLVFEEMVVLKIYLVKHQKSMTRITFEFTRIRESIGSTHRDIFTKLYNTIIGVTNTRSKAKGWRYGVDDAIRQRHFVAGESHQ
jgi:hypothetical protein